MFYLTTHSTHSIYGYMASADRSATVEQEGRKEGTKEGRKEGERNVLFNDTLNTFYLRLYGVRERERNVLFNDTLNTFYLRLYGISG